MSLSLPTRSGVQSTGGRTIPDVSLVADPATGAWIADPYNQSGDNPFEVVGGTSLAAPSWAGLVALANQGRVVAGEQALDSASPTDTQQALYSLPQSDYHVIASGSNGYTAASGYNLVTGLGTPVANLLLSDLVAYQGPGTSYSGPAVAALQNVELVNTEVTTGAPTNVFSVFDSLTYSSNGAGRDLARRFGSTNDVSQAAGAAGQDVSGQALNIANRLEGALALASLGERLAPPPVLVPAGMGPGLASLDLALADVSIGIDTPNSSVRPVTRIRLGSCAVGDGKMARARLASPAPAIDPAALDALLVGGWSARSSWLATRPGTSAKRFL